MTRTLYTRDSKFMRFVSMIVALSFTLSLAGSGFASTTSTDPNAASEAEVTQSTEPTPAAAPAEGNGSGQTPEAAPDAATPEEPSGEDPVPSMVPRKSGKSLATEPGSVKTADGATAAVVTPMAGSGDVSIVDFQGYHRGQTKWTNGNLGKDYAEGDWVPYRLVLRNTGDAPVDVSDIAIALDHFGSNPNAAVMFDRTRYWSYALRPSAPGTNDGDGQPAGSAGLTCSSQDAPEGGGWGAGATIRTDIPGGQFSMDPGEYAVVYFQGHLALTVYWNFIQPGTDGAGTYPGSSGHGYLEMSAGSRTLPLPSVATPGGSIKVVKYYDTDHDGQKDPSETTVLPGWTMHLHGTDGFDIDISKQTDANGEALFTPLPPGTYQVHEDLTSGWSSNSDAVTSVTLVDGEEVPVYIGNFRPDLCKTWSLSIGALPTGAAAYVDYKVNGTARTSHLVGSGPYTAEISVPYGAEITDIEWYVMYNGQKVVLGTSADETLTDDKTNSLTYSSTVSGMKYSDDDGNGAKGTAELGLSGWEIVLKRVVGSVETTYATTTTGVGGGYSFSDVLPGTYKVYEVQKSGFLMTDWPASSFAVANGTVAGGLDFGNLPVASSVEISKGGPERVHVGDTITYTFTVTNTGNNLLTNVVVTDPALWATGHVIGTLLPGASVSFTATRTAPASPDPLLNTAVVTGSDVLGGLATDSDDHVVDMIKPGISVTKSADTEMVVSGDAVTYTYVVTNSGEDTLTGVALTDDQLVVPGGAIGTLAPGASVTLTAVAPLTVTTTNVATAVGTDVLGLEVQDTATEVVQVVNPAISLTKTALPTVVVAGESVMYTYLVTNTGDIALHDIAVTDDKLGPIGIVAALAPGGTATLTATVPIGADVINIGTATGFYGVAETDFFGSVSDTDDACVDVIAPSIDVEKSASASPVLAGETVIYTYVVTNDGDVPLINVSVDDDKLGHIADIASLAVGASRTFTSPAVLTETTTNIVTATATDEMQNEVSDTDTAMVEVFSPSISIVKTAAPTVVLSGETVTYTYVVENTGDVWLHDVAVTDDKLGAIGSVASLDPGEVATFTTSAPIAADVTNTGTVVGEYGGVESEFGGTVTDSDDAVVNVVNPDIEVAKTASPDAIIAGESVVYTYTVTNAGDVDLFDVTLTDDKLGVVGTLPSLAVGASSTFSASATLSVPTTNTVTALGTDQYGHEVTDEAEAFVDVALPFTPPDVTIDKSADKTVARAGDTVRYTLTYRNLGPGVAQDITIVDDFDERYVSVTDAAGGTVADGKITWSIAGPLYPEDEPRTITYTVRIDSDLPADVKVVRNTVVISEPTEENVDNNSDSWRVDIGDEPFLPFTGGAWSLLALSAMAAGALGVMLRRIARATAS